MSFRPAESCIVLVVEDEPMTRFNAICAIEDAGYGVLAARNAEEAILLLEETSDIRIVFTDIDMPGSMDGLKLAAAVRDRWPPIEIIVTSGCAEPTAADLPERSVFFPKPWNAERLTAELRRLVA